MLDIIITDAGMDAGMDASMDASRQAQYDGGKMQEAKRPQRDCSRLLASSD